MECREAWVLIGILSVYAALSLFLWGPFETHFDNPGYTDPAASYVLGQGFTSGCWYFQGCDEFWAGNVPLHQFLLIPWFKAFGFSSASVKALNMLYIVLGMGLLWLGMVRGRLIATARWRLGAIAFFLVSDSSLSLAISGRPEPLCLLIACAAWFFLSLERRAYRWGGLAGCGLLAPWAGLHLAAFFAFAGIGTVLFYQKRYWKEVLALAAGGVAGSVALLGFYRHFGMLDMFIVNICPHMSISFVMAAQKTDAYIKWITLIKSWGWRLGGFGASSLLFAAFLSIWVSATSFLTGRSRRLAALNIGCITGLPALFIAAGVFPRYYGVFLMLPITVTLFGLLSAGVMRDRRGSGAIQFLPWISLLLPGAYLWCIVIQAWPAYCSGRDENINAFVKKVVRSEDVALVDPKLWYAAKPRVKKTFSGLWKVQAGVSKNRDELSVVITSSSDSATCSDLLSSLPGKWQSTGEQLQVPDFQRFYRSNKHNTPFCYEVYRRVDRP
jgi:hypothetical protein